MTQTASAEKEGLAARRAALLLWQAVRNHDRQLDIALDDKTISSSLAPRDMAFAHAVAASALRNHGEIEAILKRLMQKALPRKAGPVSDILHLGLAQLLFMESNAPAAINLSVELAKADEKAKHFAGLINAVLRKAMDDGLGARQPRLNMPGWLAERLDAAYGPTVTDEIAAANATEAPIDITVRADAALWAERLNGELLPTGTIRLAGHKGSITELPGFAEGAWWVQDAAAALPVKLLGDVSGKTVLDLCAAPGGKTAQLASLGAQVTAVDISRQRMARLEQNLARLQLNAECQVADVLKLEPDTQYDVVLLDAPCSATGTMRRHPDLAHLKSASQLDKLQNAQRRLLVQAASLVRPGGTLLYCVCSLLPVEGEEQVQSFLSRHEEFAVQPAEPLRLGGESRFLTADGMLRTLPNMQIGNSMGLDGFFAASFRRH